MQHEGFTYSYGHRQFLQDLKIHVGTLTLNNNINNSNIDSNNNIDTIYGVLTKGEVKTAGYWPGSFLRVYGRRPAEWRSINEQTWSIKDLLYGFRGNFFCGSTPRAGKIEPTRRIRFIFPAHGASHI